MRIKSVFEKVKILRTKKYSGYICQKEVIEDFGAEVVIDLCYSSYNGVYIGSKDDAKFLCKKRGLRKLQPLEKDGRVCAIGFSKKEQKWYGWSHHGIAGFGVGSKVTKKSVMYRPDSVEGLYSLFIKFHDERDVKKIPGVGIVILHRMLDVINPTSDVLETEDNGHIDIQFIPIGPGKWKAKTLEDAKQMAIEFVKALS